ncbi:MAG TPA: glutathione S-transferase family protein [Caulobacteraceae bacterium]|nr:glutathione S-transferase family protein [Caulobacteraceae bacterium]
MSAGYLLYGQKGAGSVAIEAALVIAGAPYDRHDFAHADLAGAGFNPLAQVPALRLPSGEVMTESAAILAWLAEAHPDARLAPPPGDPARPAFLRWMAFVSSAIYAHYWALDFPVRLTGDAAAQGEIVKALEARIAQCWGIMEAGIEPGDYLLGDRLSVLDLYVTVVSRWTPRKALHETIAPKIGAVARRVEADPRLADLWADRFSLKTGS